MSGLGRLQEDGTGFFGSRQMRKVAEDLPIKARGFVGLPELCELPGRCQQSVGRQGPLLTKDERRLEIGNRCPLRLIVAGVTVA